MSDKYIINDIAMALINVALAVSYDEAQIIDKRVVKSVRGFGIENKKIFYQILILNL
jgi:hypothetical protein